MQALRRQIGKTPEIRSVVSSEVEALRKSASWHDGCLRWRRNMGSGREFRVDGRSSGFTLVELMITVTIIGVLALLATVGYGKWIRTSKTAEATAMLGAIKSAQEVFRAERLRYADVSVGNLATMYPTSAPNDQKVAWNPASCSSTAICAAFLTLNVQAESYVYYRYSTIAGAAGPAVAFDTFTTPTNNDPWFVARARGDLDANGVFSSYYITSYQTTILKVDPDE